MSVYAQFAIRQLRHFIRHLDLRLKIELFLLLLVFTAFFSEQLIQILTSLNKRPTTTPLGIVTFVEHTFIFLFILTTPFIFQFLLPRQNSIQTIRPFSPQKWDVFYLLLFEFVKFQSFIFVATLPVLIAIALVFNFICLLHFLVTLFVSVVLLFLLGFYVGLRIRQSYMRFTIFYIICVSYFVVLSILYLYNPYYYILPVIVAIAGLFLLGSLWNKSWDTWELFIPQTVDYQKRQLASFHIRFPFRSSAIQMLFSKELISYLRNKYFLRIKISGYVFYSAMLISVRFMNVSDELSGVAVVTLIFIWFHYTHQFNEKYVNAESRFFLKTFPIYYHQLWLSKFLTEFLFILPILFLFVVALIAYGAGTSTIVLMTAGALIYALFILITIIMIRLLFYDNVRLAGYTYHFMVIFNLVMIGHYYLVGPIITIGILIYLYILSYRKFYG